MNLKNGDIYIVRFHPVYGSELKRYRPAVIISNRVNRIDPRFTLIAPLTTKNDKYNSKYEILIDNDELTNQSVLLLWYLRTVDITRLESKIGSLNDKDLNKMHEKLSNLFH